MVDWNKGNYEAAGDTPSCMNEEEVRAAACKEMRLWIIEFSIKGIGNGCAVAKAGNPKQAEILLKTQGMYNGQSYLYDITRIEEIIPSPDSMLICEQLAVKV